ncbi:MAG: TetR/AcrR family transcriptional regulator [Myxococcales bacterium]|nr:TetR/AcrR family transcriptional regulator [Myxococcales bacterium]MCB9606762.1 TetR/AcrR family transcriptional regulator [Polyangiaceae bacterium]
MVHSLFVPQRLKLEMRERLLSAARAELAERGYAGTRLSAVAARAESSVGNLYKYYPGKVELFEAAIPAALVSELRGLLETRVKALGGERDAFSLPTDHPYLGATDALHAFTLRHKDALRFLLIRAEGSPYRGFAANLSDDLVKWALRYASDAYPAYCHSALRQRVLSRIYRQYLTALGEILESEPSPRRLREAVALQSRYHLSGLAGFFSAPET